MKEKRRKFYQNQIQAFKESQHLFNQFNKILVEILTRIAKECSSNYIIQDRVKTLQSFADKIHSQTHYRNPLEELIDLSGVRVIVSTVDEVKEICKLIEKNFQINWQYSGDKSEALKVSEFGYLSKHYAVQLLPSSFLYKDLGISKKFFNLKGEIQVRTVIQHAWATIYHDAGYKGKFEIPQRWQREFHRMAAILENVDDEFTRIVKNLKDYECNYGAYMSEEQIKDEIERLEIISSIEPTNLEVIYKIAKMAMCLEDWEKAIAVLEPVANPKNLYIMREMGIALCKHNREGSPGFERGQQVLEEVLALNPTDTDAASSLGGTWKNIDEEKAYYFYKKAFEINPTDPYALGNYLVYEIHRQKSLSPIEISKPILQAAINKCKSQIAVGLNIPWAFFDCGLFHCFLGQLEESLTNYLLGIHYSTDDWMISTTLKTVDLLNVIDEQLPDLYYVQILLLLGLAYNFRNLDAIKRINSYYEYTGSKLKEPIIIVAGSTAFYMESRLNDLKENLVAAFKGFRGTVISGGTTSGISGIIGDIQEVYPNSITTIGYVPQIMQDSIQIDTRYSQIRRSSGTYFTVREAVQYWLDIWLNGIDNRKVKVLGVYGGKITQFEYNLGLIFGARVALINGEEREDTLLGLNIAWCKTRKISKKNLKPTLLNNNLEDIAKFINR